MPLHNVLSKAIRPPARSSMQARFVVAVVAGLVGVDEREIEAARTGIAEQVAQRVRRRRQAQVDASGDASLVPVPPRDARPLVADVAAHEPPVGGSASATASAL